MQNTEDVKMRWMKFCETRIVCKKDDPQYQLERNFFLELYYHLVFKVADNMAKKLKR
jgi:hypothetical protein